jgi:hypothetical protein
MSEKEGFVFEEAPGAEKVKIFALGIGEQNKDAHSLIALEMHDTRKTEFPKKPIRKRSLDRIFGKLASAELDLPDKSMLKQLPRRSIAGDLLLRDTSESDDEADGKGCVEVLHLQIGEEDPATNSLVAIEMKDTQRIGFRKGCNRRKKKSVDRIFRKLGTIGVADVDQTSLKGLPRRSLVSGANMSYLRNDESDEENENMANENIQD